MVTLLLGVFITRSDVCSGVSSMRINNVGFSVAKLSVFGLGVTV